MVQNGLFEQSSCKPVNSGILLVKIRIYHNKFQTSVIYCLLFCLTGSQHYPVWKKKKTKLPTLPRIFVFSCSKDFHWGTICQQAIKFVLGIQSTALQWFQSYVSDRYQSTSVNNLSLSPSQLMYGVPQDSVLFVLYIHLSLILLTTL